MWLTLAQYPSGVAETVEQAAAAGEAAAGNAGAQLLLLLITACVLALFVGSELISKIPSTLHTPLLSTLLAISGISIVGAIGATGTGQIDFASIHGLIAIVLATANIVAGFLMTHRLLRKFKP